MMPATFLRFPNGRYSERYLQKDIDSIQDLYRSNGFRDVAVKSQVEDNYGGHEGEIGVKLTIDEGRQWTVASLDLEGVAEADRAYLISFIHCTPGQPFSEFNVANDRDNVLSYYYNNGYPNATFDWNEAPGSEQRKVNLRYIVHQGNRELVRRIIINGLDTTRPRIVQDRIEIHEGDPVSRVKIADAQRRLYDLGIFAKVQTAVQNPEGIEPSKYVLFQIEEARQYSINVGVGAELGTHRRRSHHLRRARGSDRLFAPRIARRQPAECVRARTHRQPADPRFHARTASVALVLRAAVSGQRQAESHV